MTETGSSGTFRRFSTYFDLTVDNFFNADNNWNVVKYDSRAEINPWELKSAANANETKYERESSMRHGSCLWNAALKASR